jgi:16S rRNA (adenine1518-N6/adenine1519-N6)-dimethyltransferase
MATYPYEDVKESLKKLGLRARKHLGQHFLVDEEVLSCILKTAEVTPDDTVIEVGPGLGILTEALAKKARRLIAVELDERLAALLRNKLVGYPRVRVVAENILNTSPEYLLETLPRDDAPEKAGAAETYKVVANLPYYITSPVLRHFLEASLKPGLMVIMVQKEVAEAIAATPGSMSLLSVSVQFYGKPTIVKYVPAKAFYPPPKVDSAIVRIEAFDKPALPVDNVELFFKVVSAGFSSRRKQIHNALTRSLGVDRNTIYACLDQSNIERQRRAESLSLEEWARLYKAFKVLDEFKNL